MTHTAAEPMVELWRGGLLESVHRGHAVICDDKGQVVESWGNPGEIIFPRSSCKMIQALPLMESGAFDAAGLTEPHAAFACASSPVLRHFVLERKKPVQHVSSFAGSGAQHP